MIMGAVLLTLAAVMGVRQWLLHRRLLRDIEIDPVSYQLMERQIRHRLIVSGLLFLIGVGIPAGDQLDVFFRAHPGLFPFYWMIILGLVFVMVVVALSDALNSLQYARQTQSVLRQQRKELEEDIRRYKQLRRGDSDTTPPE